MKLRSLLASSLVLFLVACGGGCGGGGESTVANAPLDLSLLQEVNPKNEAELRAADSVALSYLSKAWGIAGNTAESDRILDELERRGTAAFGIGREWATFLNTTPNPADTIYVVTLVQVADAFRLAGRDNALQLALAELDKHPLVNGGCWPNSLPDVPAGCLHNVNLITAAFLSRVGRNIDRELTYSIKTMLSPGVWLYWEDAPEPPPGEWTPRRITDAGHLGWSAFELLQARDPRLQELGRQAADYVHRTYDPSKQPYFAEYAVAAAEVVAGLPGGCSRAAALPQWASENADKDPDRKARQWAAFVHVWAQITCSPHS